MTTTTPENATTWRDLIDELTPKQVATLTEWERSDAEAPLYTLVCARDYVEHNLIDLELSEVQLPAGAETDGWEKKTEAGKYVRVLVWKTFGKAHDKIAIIIDGRQESDGTYTRLISVYADSQAELTSEQARDAAARLLAAADELDAMGTEAP